MTFRIGLVRSNSVIMKIQIFKVAYTLDIYSNGIVLEFGNKNILP